MCSKLIASFPMFSPVLVKGGRQFTKDMPMAHGHSLNASMASHYKCSASAELQTCRPGPDLRPTGLGGASLQLQSSHQHGQPDYDPDPKSIRYHQRIAGKIILDVGSISEYRYSTKLCMPTNLPPAAMGKWPSCSIKRRSPFLYFRRTMPFTSSGSHGPKIPWVWV